MADNKLDTPYYIFYADEFIKNYHNLESAFRSIYPEYHIAYSFKTNYTPAVCKIVKELGGYAEVVSDMEYTLARKIGFDKGKIIYNGPGKGVCLTECLLTGGKLHVDNNDDLAKVFTIASENPDKKFNVGVRVNFDVDNGLLSRFGYDYSNGDFSKCVGRLNSVPNVKVNGIHFHISRARSLDTWRKRIEKLLEIVDEVFDYDIDYIDLGSGMFGDLGSELREQFGNPPSYMDYASVVAGCMAKHFKERSKKPLLFTEPGTTIVARYFHLFTTVLDIKTIREKSFALLDSSFHNVGEICGLKKVPIEIHENTKGNKQEAYRDLDLVGYTCLEQDVIYRNLDKKIAKDDLIEIKNVGGYSIVDKPPFIHPDIPIYMIKNGEMSCVKRGQTFDDIFAPYIF